MAYQPTSQGASQETTPQPTHYRAPTSTSLVQPLTIQPLGTSTSPAFYQQPHLEAFLEKLKHQTS